MKKTKIFLLRMMGLIAAALIVLDAGSFYQDGVAYESWYQGYVQAGLVELFLAITISVRLKGKLANTIINFLTVLLFVQAVTVSAITTALPAWETITKIKTGDQVASVLADGLAQEKQNAAYMRKNKQSTNLAIAVKAQRKERAKLVELLAGSTESELKFWIQLGTAIALKLTLQLVNLWLFWLAGYYRREALTQAYTEEVPALTPEAKVLTQDETPLTEKDKAFTDERKPLTPKTVVVSPKTIMDKLGLTPSGIADSLGVSRTIVSNVVNHYNPVMKHLMGLAKA